MAVMTVSYHEGFMACSYGETICVYQIGMFVCTMRVFCLSTTSTLLFTIISHLVCSSAAVLLVVGSEMGSAKLVKSYEEHHKRVESIKLDVSDPQLGQGIMVSAGKDGDIKYWGLAEDKSIQTFKATKEAITCVTFDKHRIVVASKENKIKIFDFSSN